MQKLLVFGLSLGIASVSFAMESDIPKLFEALKIDDKVYIGNEYSSKERALGRLKTQLRLFNAKLELLTKGLHFSFNEGNGNKFIVKSFNHDANTNMLLVHWHEKDTNHSDVLSIYNTKELAALSSMTTSIWSYLIALEKNADYEQDKNEEEDKNEKEE